MNNLQLAIVVGLLAMVVNVQAQQEDAAVLIDGPEVDLSLSDVQRSLLSLSEADRMAILSNPEKLRIAIDSTYLAKVAEHRALAKGLDRKPEVSARLWNRRMNVLAEAEVEDQVNIKLGNLRMAAREYYELHKDEFKVPEMVHAFHILLQNKPEEDDAVLRQQIEDIRARILTGEISFEEAAKKYSQDSSAPKAGDLGVFSRGRMVKPFEDVAFSLEPGKLSEPVKTRFGYHLIKVQERIPARQNPYEKVKPTILEKLKTKKAAQIKEDYLIQIRDDPRIKVNQSALDAFLKTPYLK
jgi:peptidyl-prolyl cis-trans isomerase C